MFWSGNYIAVRELSSLLKEENVTLSQVLEADDILQECKADNKALIQFLTKPDVLAELITLITEEPPKYLELTNQYRHASIACEVLTSHLSMLSDKLSMDTVQMNRLCDFINVEPPLNPLLASYFSKTVEMLLERNPKQDWYLYHIVCLRVLDFFHQRRDFLPNLLRHMATSAIADTFKYFIRLDDLFNKIVMEWLDEHQFLDNLIHIMCGSYVTEPLAARAEPAPAPAPGLDAPPEHRDRPETNHRDDSSEDEVTVVKHVPLRTESVDTPESPTVAEAVEAKENHELEAVDAKADAETEAAANQRKAERIQAIASANASALLCDLILTGCTGDGCSSRSRTSCLLTSRLAACGSVRGALQAVFTSAAAARPAALVAGCQLLLALLSHDPILRGDAESPRTSVEVSVAPHLPLLHQALLRDDAADHDRQPAPHPPPPPAPAVLPQPEIQVQPAPPSHDEESTPQPPPDSQDPPSKQGEGEGPPVTRRVGLARVHVAALLAHLAASEVEEVATTLLTLGTPSALVDMLFSYPNNNFLHAQVYSLIKNALHNTAYRTQYATQLLVESDLLNRLMDAYEQNEAKKVGVYRRRVPRSGNTGHVVLALFLVARALDPMRGELLAMVPLPEATRTRWQTFLENTLWLLQMRHDTPLGGSHPSADNVYESSEVENMEMSNNMAATYEFQDMPNVEHDGDLGVDAADDLAEICNAVAAASDEEADKMLAEKERKLLEQMPLDDDMDDKDENIAEKEKAFLDSCNDRFGDYSWEDDSGQEGSVPVDWLVSKVHDIFANSSPWDGDQAAGTKVPSEECWALFEPAFDAPSGAPADPFTAAGTGSTKDEEFSPFWAVDAQPDATAPSTEMDQKLAAMRLSDERPLEDSSVELANNLLTAMSSMAPDEIANIVNANMAPEPPTHTSSATDNVMSNVEKSTADAVKESTVDARSMQTDERPTQVDATSAPVADTMSTPAVDTTQITEPTADVSPAADSPADAPSASSDPAADSGES